MSPGSPVDRPGDLVADGDSSDIGSSDGLGATGATSAGETELPPPLPVAEGEDVPAEDHGDDVTLVPRSPGFEPLPNPDLASNPGQYPSPLGPPSPEPQVRPRHASKDVGLRTRTFNTLNRSALRRRRRQGQVRMQGQSEGRVVKERLQHISLGSVLKISVVFFACAALVFAVSTIILWQFAKGTGLVEDAENFVTDLFAYGNCVSEEEVGLGENFRDDDKCSEGQVLVGSFEIDNGALFLSVVFGSIVFVAAASLATVFLVMLFNLLSDITGGIRYRVVREPLTGTGSTSGRSQR